MTQVNIKQYSNPIHVCAAARKRAALSLTDPTIKLTRLEKAFAEAMKR